MPRTHRSTDSGFTLIEMLFTMVLMGILMAIAIPSWRGYQRAQEQSGSERDLISFLRDGQVRAVDEEVKYRAVFANDGKSVTLQRWNGASWVNGGGSLSPNGATVTYDSPKFTQADGSTQNYVTFFASGAASPGTVNVLRAGSSKVYTVTVEGLTGRVSG